MDFYDIREMEDCYNIDTNFLINSMEKQLKGHRRVLCLLYRAATCLRILR